MLHTINLTTCIYIIINTFEQKAHYEYSVFVCNLNENGVLFQEKLSFLLL